MMYTWYLNVTTWQPQPDTMQSNEIRYQIRRLSHHPSIVVWDGCNECTFGPFDNYATFVMPVIAEEDKTRAIWPTSPSQGWVSGVDRLWGYPNGDPLVAFFTYSFFFT